MINFISFVDRVYSSIKKLLIPSKKFFTRSSSIIHTNANERRNDARSIGRPLFSAIVTRVGTRGGETPAELSAGERRVIAIIGVTFLVNRPVVTQSRSKGSLLWITNKRRNGIAVFSLGVLVPRQREHTSVGEKKSTSTRVVNLPCGSVHVTRWGNRY